jgi:hypothetical protein
MDDNRPRSSLLGCLKSHSRHTGGQRPEGHAGHIELQVPPALLRFDLFIESATIQGFGDCVVDKQNSKRRCIPIAEVDRKPKTPQVLCEPENDAARSTPLTQNHDFV